MSLYKTQNLIAVICVVLFLPNAAIITAQDQAPAPTPTTEVAAQPLTPAPMLVSGGGSMLFILEDAGDNSDPMPILPAFYGAFAMPFYSRAGFSIYGELSLDVYTTHYKWSANLERAVPASIEQRSSLIFGFPLALHGELRLKKGRAALRLNAGLAADFKLVLVAEDIHPTDDIKLIEAETDSIKNYMNEHWLYLDMLLGIDIQIKEKLLMGLAVRANIPTWNMVGAFLDWRFAGIIRITGEFNARRGN